jgi:3-hydroxybutyryl-CoA dehydrogenase
MGTTDVDVVGIVGAGFMGSGIAESAARAGVRVVVHDLTDDFLERSRTRVHDSMEQAVVRGKLEPDAREEALARITWTTNLGDLIDSDVVIEAIVEDAVVKADMFARLDELLPATTIIATNTSAIPIAGLAAATTRPDRFLGMHFFSPVPVMGLVEVVVGLQTAESTVEVVEAFARRLGKQPIRTKDRAGFVVSMLLIPYLMSGVRMLEEGFASREDIDDGMRLGAGHPMGPLTLADFIGLDVIASICDSLYEEFHRSEYSQPPLLKRMIASGYLGRKSGRGFYEYPAKH